MFTVPSNLEKNTAAVLTVKREQMVMGWPSVAVL